MVDASQGPIVIVDILAHFADALLIVAALYVSSQALRGYRKEIKADREDDDGEKSKLIEDAKTHYASASLLQPWFLVCIVLGTFTKAALMLFSLGAWIVA